MLNAETIRLTTRAITRLLNQEKDAFYTLAKKAEHDYLRRRHLYVTIQEIIEHKAG